jgi:hypothetical protein
LIDQQEDPTLSYLYLSVRSAAAVARGHRK